MTSLRTYNKSQLAILCTVKDPQGDAEALTELETRLAVWLTVGGGGAWLRSLPEVNEEFTK